MPNTVLQWRCVVSDRESYLRKIKAEPRSTMPMSIAVNGMFSAVIIPAKPSRETGEQQHHHQDEPDMVGLPNGADRFGDGFPLPRSARPDCQQIPHAAAKIRAAHEGIQDQ